MVSPIILYPAAGTFSISILPAAPTNKSSIPGTCFSSAAAMAMAGKICPPVPPPAIMAFIFIYAVAFDGEADTGTGVANGSTIFPSVCSTFRATLNTIPIAQQVNK